MANTFELISAVTVGAAGASSIDFTSIPSTWTDLCLKVSLRSTRSPQTEDVVGIRFNGSSSSFTSRELQGDGSTASSRSDTNGRIGLINTTSSASNLFGSMDIYIPNYAGNANKSQSAEAAAEYNTTSAYLTMEASLWSNTAAITSIGLVPLFGSNFVQYSTAYLYGVKNA